MKANFNNSCPGIEVDREGLKFRPNCAIKGMDTRKRSCSSSY